jgi:uncharacterized protein (TIGR02270 family)
VPRSEFKRTVIQATGIIGDPGSVPWLIKQMEDAEVARVAGESFSMITGVDIAYDDLEGEWPEGFEAGPTDNPEDENVDMDPDEDLPWPEPKLIHGWWEENNTRFQAGQRYLLARLLDGGNLRWVLINGQQRQRCAAALELALLEKDSPLFETGAPGPGGQTVAAVCPAASSHSVC